MDIYGYPNVPKIYFYGPIKGSFLPLLHISYTCNITISSAVSAVELILQQ